MLAVAVSACGGIADEFPAEEPPEAADAATWDGGREPVDSGVDAGLGQDAGEPVPSDAGNGDAGELDAGNTDAGSEPDAGSAMDAGNTSDAGSSADAGSSSDAGVLLPDGGCNASAFLTLEWPFPGTNGLEWVVNNYVDLDATSGGMRDYRGATGSNAKTYDNHRGIDIDVPSFREMDADFPVIAAAPGVVISVVDGYYDRNYSCSNNNANKVVIRQDDCSRATYAHMKKDSIQVAVGQRVSTGQTLAVVGSSGCSSTAHLHFELNNASGTLEEPFSTGRWRLPPLYSKEVSVMDVEFKTGSFANFDELKDPPPNPATITAGSSIAIGAITANSLAGDVLDMRLLRPNGTVLTTGSINFTQEYRHAWWVWDRVLGADPGQWTIELSVNGGPKTTRQFTVP